MAPTRHAPPGVRVPDGWERTSESADTVFEAGPVTVRAHTAVFEDGRLRRSVRDRTGADATWRFFFAGRLVLDPAAGGSEALTRLVSDRANAGFADRLRERGFDGVERAESRRFAVGRTEAALTRYRARVEMPVGDGTGDRGATTVVTAEAYLATWPDDGYLVAGGAYSVSVEDDALAGGPAGALSPERNREALFEMIRSVE